MNDNNRLAQRKEAIQKIWQLLKPFASKFGVTGIGLTAIVASLLTGNFKAALISAIVTICLPLAAIAYKSLTRMWQKFLSKLEEEMEEAEDQLIDGLWNLGKNTLKKAWWRINPTFKRNYEQALIDKYKYLRADGFNLDASALNLEEIVVSLRIIPKLSEQVNEHLLCPHDSPQSRNIWDFLPQNSEKAPRSYRRFAILGSPGTGKTTLLKQLTLSYANKRYKEHKTLELVPILLFLRDIRHLILTDKPLALPQLIRQSIKALPSTHTLEPPQGWIEDQLKMGSCLILLDGLDEVANSEDRKKVSDWVDQQMKENQRTRFILTSRPHGYNSNPLQQIEQVLEVLPFTPSDTQQFIRRLYQQRKINFYNEDTAFVLKEATNLAENLIDRLKNRRELSDMAKNPLLITMIATVHYNGDALPERRVELYKQICELLLGKRQAAKQDRETETVRDLDNNLKPTEVQHRLTYEQNKSVLQVLALSLMESETREFELNQGIAIIQAPLAEVAQNNLTPFQFFQQIKEVCGLIVEREIGVYEFAHLSFQEYLAAAQIKTLKEENSSPFNLLLANFDNPWWAETIRLYSAQSDATPLIQYAIDHPTVKTLTLALDCQQEKLKLDPKVDQELNNLLDDGLDSASSKIALLAAKVKLTRRLKTFLEIGEKREIDLYYITIAEYQLFLHDRFNSNLLIPCKHLYSSPGSAKPPVTHLDQDDALNFCSWLNQKAIILIGSENRLYDNSFYYRLPTAQEATNHPPNEHPYLQCWTMDDSENPSPSPKGLRLIKTNIPSLFSFETVKVDRQGQIIAKKRLTRQYFREILNSSPTQGNGNQEINLDMVFIPSGTFWMGTPNQKDESPQHQVILESFFLSKYPITQAQWQAIAHRTDLKVRINLDPNPSEFKGENRPVERVSWDDAVEFCQRLSKLTGKDYQLPSEAQWEYACRSAPMKNAENVGEQGLHPSRSELTQEAWHKNYEKPFYFGETITRELANYNCSETYSQEPEGKYRGETTSVGSFPPNAFGLYDMHGNVWEWCADQWHSNYEGAPNDGSAWRNNMSFSNPYVIRGGSWYSNPINCRSAYRLYFNLDIRLYIIGFRVMCAVGKTL